MGDLLNILQQFPVFKDVNNNNQTDNNNNHNKDDDVGYLNYNNGDTMKYYQEKLDVLETYLLSNDMHLAEMLDVLDDTANLQVVNENVLPLLFHLISNYHPNFNTLCGSSHRIFRIIIRDNRFYAINKSITDNEDVEVREVINVDTALRLQIALHYAKTCVNSFPDLIDTNNLAISFGAIIGSLQGGDPASPEVAVVVCALEFVAERLNKTFKTAENGGVMQLSTSKAGADVGNSKNGTYELEKYICEPLAVILIYGLEMIPSTIVSKLCEIINSIFIGIPKNSEIAFATFIQRAVQAFGDPSRRALLFRWHLGQGRARM